jgi:hypothetical protein
MEQGTRRGVLLLASMLAMLVAVGGIALAANIRGNNGPNTINGTPNNDKIRGLGGNDRLKGLGAPTRCGAIVVTIHYSTVRR